MLHYDYDKTISLIICVHHSEPPKIRVLPNRLICQKHLIKGTYRFSFNIPANEAARRASRDLVGCCLTRGGRSGIWEKSWRVLSIRWTSKRLFDIKFWHLEFPPKSNDPARHQGFCSRISSRCPLMPTFNEHIFICRLALGPGSTLSHDAFDRPDARVVQFYRACVFECFSEWRKFCHFFISLRCFQLERRGKKT